MTADANPLTFDATGSAQPPWPASQLRAFSDAFERLGYPVTALLEKVGLQSDCLKDPDGLVPCELFGRFFAIALAAHPLPNAGVRLAAVTPIGAYPLIDYLALSSDDVGQAVTLLSRYFRLLGGPALMEIDADSEPVRVRYQSVTPDAVPGFSVEYGLALLVLHLKRETDQRVMFEHVSVMHQPDDLAEIERLLGCPVHAGAASNGLALTRESWREPLRRRDPVLRALLERQAFEPRERKPAPDGIESEVRRVLVPRLARGDAGVDAVARDLAMSTRTLQRRLTESGSAFEDVVDRTRQELAETHLSASSLSASEIAYLLGYSEPAAFHRAFKRWTGNTPQAFRKSRSTRV